jgi:hypothetical protein
MAASQRMGVTGTLRSALALLLAPVVGSCTSLAPNVVGWEGALSGLAGQREAIYSFRFTSDTPDGVHGQVAVHEASAAEACGRYDGAADANVDYWFLDFEFGDVVQGTYVITTSDALATKAKETTIHLLHRQNGEYTETFPALSGTVTLGASLSVGAAKSGVAVALQVHATFAALPLQQLGCSGGEAADSSVVTAQCSCRDPEGIMTTCIPNTVLDYCCPAGDGGTVTFDFSLAAQPCAAMCRAAVGLANECAAVVP